MSPEFGKVLVILGIIFVVIGLILSSGLHIPWFGRLPGDFYIKRDNFRFYFPLATSILISILLSTVLYFFRR